MVERDNANAHVQWREEARQEVLCSYSITGSATYPSSPEYALRDLPEGDAAVDHVGEETVDRAGEDAEDGA